eukprot:CAMPEP_0185730352 /NCGR_PEP_ID=MMETSP1171-20130828/9644_1 /TAXON_ID=374046 /ORGANISM="Helicotheca tamensis, Strain CCMP826" /LENGTH=304 /DNA_ID=CAMNT_0028399381 /DNA_START=116 /DNA_END=1027 /DNA_ORIENTATION=+
MTTSSHPRKFHHRMSMFAIAIVGTCLLNNAMDSVETNNAWASIRQLDSTETISNPETMVIHFYIKTSGQDKYFNRAKRMVKTWGMDGAAGGGKMILMMDGKNRESVDAFGAEHSYLDIVHVDGTDRQGDYKKGSPSHEDLREAFHAQRVKTRAVFTEFVSSRNGDEAKQPPDWMCYLDDDMMVNVTNLKTELGRLWHSCTPNCFIADGLTYTGGVDYTSCGYCMERDLASRIEAVLSEKTDEELKWVGNDDVEFNRMLKQELNVARINSEYWYSQESKPKVTGTLMEKVTYWDEGYGETVTPNW